MSADYRVLRYIKGTPNCGTLIHASNGRHLYAFCDSDWRACPLMQRSLTAYLETLGGSPISWMTKKQTTVLRSLVEAEY